MSIFKDILYYIYTWTLLFFGFGCTQTRQYSLLHEWLLLYKRDDVYRGKKFTVCCV